MDWTTETWTNALVALRDRASTVELLALYEKGVVCSVEVLSAVWERCHDKPTLRAELVRQFRNYHNEHIAVTVGDGLERLAARLAEQGSLSDARANPPPVVIEGSERTTMLSEFQARDDNAEQ